MVTLGLVLAVIFFLAGLVGTVLPVLPGAPLILAGMAVYGLITGFEHLPLYFFLGQGLLATLTFVVDYLANAWGVTRFGGSKAAIWGGVLGLLAGAFVFPPLGLVLGPFAGAFLAELAASRRSFHAFRVGVGSLVGFLGGTAVKLGIEIVMIIWFFTAIF
jgi:hypothetical protein